MIDTPSRHDITPDLPAPLRPTVPAATPGCKQRGTTKPRAVIALAGLAHIAESPERMSRFLSNHPRARERLDNGPWDPELQHLALAFLCGDPRRLNLFARRTGATAANIQAARISLSTRGGLRNASR